MRPSSEQETAYVNAIAAAPNEDTARFIFADWLEEQGDLRGEFLRLATQLEREQADAWPSDSRAKVRHVRELGKIRSRLRALQRLIDPDWIVQFHRGTIQYCNMIFDNQLFNGRDDVHCPGSWQALGRGGQPDRRHCDVCSRDVRYCWSSSELTNAIGERHPVVTATIMSVE